ncbi:MAG: hypothetical protein NVSMB19_25500 [Vulcanimicrobiaceae bacterium]
MFDPLGRFDAHADVIAGVLGKARGLYGRLPSVPAGAISRIYLHWTVGAMGACFDDYNVEALYRHDSWGLEITHDPADNATGVNDNPVASHTYMRNTGAIGVALTGMDGPDVGVHDFGCDPVTVMGLTHLCAAAAAVAKKYAIDVSGLSSGAPYGDEPTILTHAEAAMRVGVPPQYADYRDERWDLGSFTPLPDGVALTPAMIATCGNALRALSRTYKTHLL